MKFKPTFHNTPPLRTKVFSPYVKLRAYIYRGKVAGGCSKVASRLAVAKQNIYVWVAAKLRLQVASKLHQSCSRKRVILDTKLHGCSIFPKNEKSIFQKTPATAATLQLPF